MKKILKARWLVMIAWLIFGITIFFTMPSVDQLVRENSQPKIPGEYKSQIANDLIAEMDENNSDGKTISSIIVYHNDQAFTDAEQKKIEEKIKELEKSSTVKVQSIVNPFESDETKERLVSEDKKTVMTIASIELNDYTVSEMHEMLQKEAQIADIETYLTGQDFINNDFANTALEGVKKTEWITVAFILIVLIVIFRSPLTPLISLFTVGISYIVSLGIVAILAEYFGFPFSNSTQTFLILLLFGIGTDYNILLLLRFKEELGNKASVPNAIIRTYQTAGKTVFYSGLVVVVGFSMLILSQFSVYQSAVSIAVGAIFLIVCLFTITPFFMMVLGTKLFWPSKKISQHKESKLWGIFGSFSTKRPLITLLIIALILSPTLFLYQDKLSFNNLKEIDPDYRSITGFNIIADSFGPGESMPTSIVFKHDKKLDTTEGLAFIDNLSEKLRRYPGVSNVYGPTRPTGEKIEDFYTLEQNKQIKEGTTQSQEGVEEIASGLDEASSGLEKASSGDMDDVGQLIDATSQAKNGVNEMETGLKQVEGGLIQSSEGIRKIDNGLARMESNLETAIPQTEGLVAGLKKAEKGYKDALEGYTQLQTAYIGMVDPIKQTNTLAGTIASDTSSPHQGTGQKIVGITDLILNGSPQQPIGLNGLNTKFEEANQGLQKGNEALSKAYNDVSALPEQLQGMLNGIREVRKNLAKIENGLNQGANGQSQLIDANQNLEVGLGKINDGQRQLNDGLQEMQGKLGELQTGLDTSVEGLGQVSEGLGSVNQYLGEVTDTSAASTFFIPAEAIQNEDFQKSLDTYMSDDRKIAQISVALDVDPYSAEAMDIASTINQAVQKEFENTPYKDAVIGIGGVSAQNDDLQQVSSADFNQAITYMLLGISIVLLFLFRSFWLTVFSILSLLIAYFGSLAITEIIYTSGFDLAGLSWSAPFFAFTLIIALGADYTIFLMMRYKEYEMYTPTYAIREAMKRIGGVILSAVIILCGTFASMYPSGVTSLVQVATLVIVALILMLFIMLPLFIPAMIGLWEKVTKSNEKRIERLRRQEMKRSEEQ
ncbi:MMPL family transporter [Hazenella sp. IB182353]|uniref:MMPL family transporter n=1 Tax=Polycladospora coralii TaxID=2771432 RepID=UPI0017474CDC|nr:MMPL family transporter [Polycladospora coralii]MBS7530936.1 MMPL family transporter [Polycladospora coralii]